MVNSEQTLSLREAPPSGTKHRSLPYILPFLVFVGILSIQDYLRPLGLIEYPLRVLILAATIYFFSRQVIDFRTRRFGSTLILGVAVFGIWIAPDVLFPGYRDHWLFQNRLTGQLVSSIPADMRADTLVLVFRFLRAVVLVPIVEELFWRAWMMRWIISPNFEKIPLGSLTPLSMIGTAVLFASEHGPYWDVGLITGFIYNWWMVRTKSLGDCILAHAVTNACLSGYVIVSGRWEYWM